MFYKENIINTEITHSYNGCGKMIRQKEVSYTKLIIKSIMYVYDAVFPFGSYNDLVRGMKIVYEIMGKWGLTIHLGQNNTDPKIKVMFFPGYSKLSSWKRTKTLMQATPFHQDNSAIEKKNRKFIPDKKRN